MLVYYTIIKGRPKDVRREGWTIAKAVTLDKSDPARLVSEPSVVFPKRGDMPTKYVDVDGYAVHYFTPAKRRCRRLSLM